MIIVGALMPDFRANTGSVRVAVELGTPCDSCAMPIGKTEPALYRWWRETRADKATGRRSSGSELVHVACVRPPASADPIMAARP